MVKPKPAPGTRFEYWAPKGAKQWLPPKAKGEASPKKLVQQRFKVVKKVPFGSKAKLGISAVIPRWEIIAAALNAGYGSREALAAGAIPKLTKPSELRNYLRQRLEMLHSCITPAASKLLARPFLEVVESSEKNAVSFIAGCVGTYVAARRWIRTSGTTMCAFLHVGLYTKAAAVGPTHYVALTKSGARVPDFIAQDANGRWHVFESKGGSTSSRWKQIVSGLRQLEGVGAVHQLPQPPLAPLTTAVVQTRVDPGAKIELILVDPPPSGDAPDEGQPKLTVTLVPGVWQLLRFLETVDWFITLRDAASSSELTSAAALWTFAETTALGGFVLGVPTAWLKRAPEIADQMGRYFAVASQPRPQGLAEFAEQLGLQRITQSVENDLAAAASELAQVLGSAEGPDHGLTEAGLFILAANDSAAAVETLRPET